MGSAAAVDNQEAAAIRRGGFAGMLGSLSLVSVFVFLAVLVGLDTVGTEAEIQRYPTIRTTRVVENVMYLLAIVLWTLHTVALFLALRRTSYAAALVGMVMMGLGLAILATGAVPHTATDPLSALYHTPDASTETQASAIVAWTATQGVVDALVVTGLLLTPIGMGALGLAMRGNLGYRGWPVWVSLALAAAGLIAAVLILIEPDESAAIGVFAVIFFHALIGWRSFRWRSGATGD